MNRRTPLHVLFLLVLTPLLAAAQGIILPDHRRPHPMPHPMPRPIVGSYAVKSIAVDATIKDQVAQVQLSQTFRNTSSVQMEATYLFPIPHDGVIEKFTLMVDGKEMPAKLYTKEEARSIYESIVRSMRDPAILEYIGSGALQTQVFPIPPNAERQIVLNYTQVCRRDHHATEFLFPLAAGRFSNKPIEELKFNIRIDNPNAIKSVYCPTHTVDVKRPGENSATVTLTQTNVAGMEDLRVFWTLSEQPIGASILSYRPDEKEDGYFLMLAAPDVKAATTRPVAKTVIFALDKSGSMVNNKKIDQAKGALKFVLNSLSAGDTFNIIDFNDKVETFKPELQGYNDKSLAEALRYVDNIFAGGSTNIDGALKRALELAGDTGARPTYLIFLTDGLPTTGERSEARIAENATTANKSRLRFFMFGVGYDVNARLLDRLSTDNWGVSEYVRPTEDIEASVSKFYGKMAAPVLTSLRIELAGIDTNRAYPKVLPDLFAGGQVLWVGRYKAGGDAKIKVGGKVSGEDRSYEFDARLANKTGDDTYAFVEKLWAVRRVGEIINELDLKGENKELISELVGLSTKHGILTPYTAFLADDRTDLRAMPANAAKAAEGLRRGLAEQTGGAGGVNFRADKARMQHAAAAPMSGAQGYFDAEGRFKTEANCQVVANQALFKRANLWTDPSITEEEQKKAEVVEQFSDRYFELARDNAPLRKFLAMPDGCLVKVQGKVYQINAAQNKG